MLFGWDSALSGQVLAQLLAPRLAAAHGATAWQAGAVCNLLLVPDQVSKGTSANKKSGLCIYATRVPKTSKSASADHAVRICQLIDTLHVDMSYLSHPACEQLILSLLHDQEGAHANAPHLKTDWPTST